MPRSLTWAEALESCSCFKRKNGGLIQLARRNYVELPAFWCAHFVSPSVFEHSPVLSVNCSANRSTMAWSRPASCARARAVFISSGSCLVIPLNRSINASAFTRVSRANFCQWRNPIWLEQPVGLWSDHVDRHYSTKYFCIRRCHTCFGEPHGPALVPDEPALGDRAVHAGPVLAGSAAGL